MLTMVSAASAVSIAGDRLPRVVSLNLCTDLQLLLLADPEQIVSLTWLARDPRSSPLAGAAQRFAFNRGQAEDVLPFAPDVVLAGTYSTRFTVDLLRRQGVRVVEFAPVTSLDDVAQTTLRMGAILGQETRAQRLVAEFHESLNQTAGVWAKHSGDRGPRNRAVLLGAGGFTGGADSLAGNVLTHLGLVDAARRYGAKSWGRVGLEELLRLHPDILVITTGSDASREPSMAIEILNHPALHDRALGMRRILTPTTYWSCGTPLVARAAATLAAAAPAAASIAP